MLTAISVRFPIFISRCRQHRRLSAGATLCQSSANAPPMCLSELAVVTHLCLTTALAWSALFLYPAPINIATVQPWT